MNIKKHWLFLVSSLLLSFSHFSLAEESKTELGTFISKDGKTAQFPDEYRSWEHVGTRLSVGGTNILDKSKIDGGMFLNIYADPVSFQVFKRSGKWPDGTVLVKEFSDILKGQGCDKTTLACNTPYGHGVFQQDFSGMGMMVKDKKLFDKTPGNWGYYNFGHKTRSEVTTGKLMEESRCSACHVTLASKTDYVFAEEHIRLKQILDTFKN